MIQEVPIHCFKSHEGVFNLMHLKLQQFLNNPSLDNTILISHSLPNLSFLSPSIPHSFSFTLSLLPLFLPYFFSLPHSYFPLSLSLFLSLIPLSVSFPLESLPLSLSLTLSHSLPSLSLLPPPLSPISHSLSLPLQRLNKETHQKQTNNTKKIQKNHRIREYGINFLELQ